MHFTLGELLRAEKKMGRVGGGMQKGFGMPTLDACGASLWIYSPYLSTALSDTYGGHRESYFSTVGGLTEWVLLKVIQLMSRRMNLDPLVPQNRSYSMLIGLCNSYTGHFLV